MIDFDSLSSSSSEGEISEVGSEEAGGRATPIASSTVERRSDVSQDSRDDGMEIDGGGDDAGLAVNEEMSKMLDLIESKCSICFCQDSDLELPHCGDQFCVDCIEKYWMGRLEGSAWGIRTVVLDCPVCRVLLRHEHDHVWIMSWCSTRLGELLRQCREKKALIVRVCTQCGHEQTLVGDETSDPATWDQLLEAIWEEELVDLAAADTLRRKVQMTDYNGMLRVIRNNLLRDLNKPHPALIYLLRRILRENRRRASADYFAQLQLSCLTLCSGTVCDFCTLPICLRCGESDWHPGKTCVEHLSSRLYRLTEPCIKTSSPATAEDQFTLRWQLERAKQCPRCFLLTSKDDDGGCNQMRCVYCAFTYCWECLREWSPQCGYYQCLQQGKDANLLRRERKMAVPIEDRAEAGVPDVTKLPSFSPLQD